MELVERVGADALRMYLLSSPIVRGEDLSVTEKDILELQRKNIGRLHNVLAMYEMYAGGEEAHANSEHVLDKWIIARLNETVRDVTTGFKAYELDKATRPLEGLIDDISVWYLRRSRDRLKSTDEADKKATLSTLRFVLKNLAQIMAPVMPFYAEHLFQRVRAENDAESVHLMPWPKGGEVDAVVLGEMSIVREFVTLALEARTKANIKVRQPLASLAVNIELEPAYAEIVCEEINVKKVIANIAQSERVVLDTVITPELKREGDVRELMRAIQDTRKKMGLMAHDRVLLTVNSVMHDRIHGFEAEVMGVCGIDSINLGDSTTEQVTLGDDVCAFGVVKV
jgi:isoleucyl-tRNA synthetase